MHTLPFSIVVLHVSVFSPLLNTVPHKQEYYSALQTTVQYS
jgi:hypothetical protein